MKKSALALFVALAMGVTTFGVIETAYAQQQPSAGSGSSSGSDTTKPAKKKRRRRKKKTETPPASGFVMSNQF